MIALMAVYWCTEVIPLAVTALLPALLFPLFGIMESGDVSEITAAKCRKFFSKKKAFIDPCLTLFDPAVSGLYAVLEGYKHVVCGGTDIRRSRGALESAQAHCFEGPAVRWCASSAVSGQDVRRHCRFSN